MTALVWLERELWAVLKMFPCDGCPTPAIAVPLTTNKLEHRQTQQFLSPPTWNIEMWWWTYITLSRLCCAFHRFSAVSGLIYVKRCQYDWIKSQATLRSDLLSCFFMIWAMFHLTCCGWSCHWSGTPYRFHNTLNFLRYHSKVFFQIPIFLCTLLSWFYWRLWILPSVVLRTILFDSRSFLFPCVDNCFWILNTERAVFVIAIGSLLVLHVMWFYKMLLKGYREIFGSSKKR